MTRVLTWLGLAMGAVVMVSVGAGLPVSAQQPAVRCNLTNPSTDGCAVFRMVNNDGSSLGARGYVDHSNMYWCHVSANSYCSVAVAAGVHTMSMTADDDRSCGEASVNIPAGQERTYTCTVRAR